jgi:hypothetical protein
MSKERHPVTVRNDIIDIMEFYALPITKERVKEKHIQLRKLFKEYIRADKERYSDSYFEKQKKAIENAHECESPF